MDDHVMIVEDTNLNNVSEYFCPLNIVIFKYKFSLKANNCILIDTILKNLVINFHLKINMKKTVQLTNCKIIQSWN